MARNNKIVSTGRGGVGKTSLVALMAKYFIEDKDDKTPILVVDADPDENFAEMVGIDLESEGIKTISCLLAEMLEEGGTTVGIAPRERIGGKIFGEGLYEGDAFDIMAIGTKWMEGCYCMPNAALKSALDILTKNYKYILIDSPAGLEHLNRRITPEVGDIFILLDRSKKSFAHVERAHRIIKEIGIEYENMYIVGGYRFPDDWKDRAERITGLKYLGTIAEDEVMDNFVRDGISLLDLPVDSPAYVSVKEIMKEAGYC